MIEKKKYLDFLYQTFDGQYVPSDPIRLVKRFKNPADQEIVAIVISALAFGQVQQIIKAGEMVLSLMDHKPADFLAQLNPTIEMKRWKKFYYRMVRHTDILRVLWALKNIKQNYSLIGNWVESKYDKSDAHLGETWARCVEEIKKMDRKLWVWTRSRGVGFNHLLPNPLNPSACKRAHLLLRWMVRKDDIDLGLWNLPASKLLIPVDTHIQRLAYNIGLTDRQDLSSKTAVEITEKLRIFDPEDPVKYDFALCRLGILKMCPKKRDFRKCEACPIYEICRL